MEQAIRVVLADDHPIYREGVARTLADAGGIEVVGQAADGEAAVEMTRSLAPDLVLLDISMPNGPVPVSFRSFESNTRHQGDRIWQRYTATSSSGMRFALRSPVA